MKMRVLLKVAGDYMIEEVLLVKYSTFDESLYITTPSAIYETHLCEKTAVPALQSLNANGFHDFSAYTTKKIHNRGGRI